MAPFDAELYLRLLGERGLVSASPQQRGRDIELSAVARALVAVGAIDAADAQTIVREYERAAGLRNGRGLHDWHHHQRSAPPAPEPRRTVMCNVTVERPTEEIRVRSVTLSASETRLSVLITEPSGAKKRNRRNAPMRAMFSYRVTDDRGGKGTTDFTGGGSDREWRGRLNVNPPLAVDTAWIEIEGSRIELIEEAASCTVIVEPIADGDSAQRYLWHWLAAGERHGRPQMALDSVLDALITSGRLDVDEPQIEALRDASQRQRPRMPGGPGGPGPALYDGAPPEWRSFLSPRPGRRHARGTVGLAAATPAFDGVTVTATELTADDHGWQVEVDVTGAGIPGPFGGPVDDVHVAWWAVDDRGQYYLGNLGSFSGSPAGLSGSVEFGPALDRSASTLTLLPTGPSERARIEFPLTWSEQ